MSEPSCQRAALLFDHGRYADAARELREFLATEPEHAGAHGLLGLCLCQLRDDAEALREAALAVQLAPDEARLHFWNAIILVRVGRAPSAVQAIGEAIRLDPSQPDFYGIAAELQFTLGNPRSAQALIERGLSLDSENQACRTALLSLLERQGKDRQLLDSALEALAIDPQNSAYHVARGLALLGRGDHRQAEQGFRDALRIDPQDHLARRGLVSALKSRNLAYRGLSGLLRFARRLHGFALPLILVAVSVVVTLVWGNLVAAESAVLIGLLTLLGGLFAGVILYGLLAMLLEPMTDFLFGLWGLPRIALTYRERWSGALLIAWFVGALGALTLGAGWRDASLLYFGFMGLVASIPFALCLRGWAEANLREPLLLFAAGVVLTATHDLWADLLPHGGRGRGLGVKLLLYAWFFIASRAALVAALARWR